MHSLTELLKDSWFLVTVAHNKYIPYGWWLTLRRMQWLPHQSALSCLAEAWFPMDPVGSWWHKRMVGIVTWMKHLTQKLEKLGCLPNHSRAKTKDIEVYIIPNSHKVGFWTKVLNEGFLCCLVLSVRKQIKEMSLVCLSVQKLTQFCLTIGAGRHSLHYISCLALASSAILAWLEGFRLGHRHSMNFIHALT